MAAKTQPRTHAAMTGRRYGSFAGKTTTTIETDVQETRLVRSGGTRLRVSGGTRLVRRRRP